MDRNKREQMHLLFCCCSSNATRAGVQRFSSKIFEKQKNSIHNTDVFLMKSKL